MAKLTSPNAVVALDTLDEYVSRYLDEHQQKQFLKMLDILVRVVQNDAEKALMKGKGSHLGNYQMLLHHLNGAVGICYRPWQRIAMEEAIRDSLNTYLGISFKGPGKRRMRRKLLPHV